MTTQSDRESPQQPASAAVGVFRRALRDVLIFLGVVTLIGCGLGMLIAGVPGLWGALLGVFIAAFFSGTTVLVMIRTGQSSPHVMAAWILGSWLIKMAVVIAVLSVLQDVDGYHRGIFAGVLLVGALGSALLDARAVLRGRIPYVEPETSP